MAAKNPGLPSPRIPAVEEITSVDQILPAVRLIVKRKPPEYLTEGLEAWFESLNLKPGEKVLILTDTSINPILTEAFTQAIKEAGGKIDMITLEGYPDLRDPVDLVDKMFSNNWFPQWVWDAIAKTDVLLQLAFLKVAHTPNVPRYVRGKPRALAWELPLDLLISDYLEYPLEVWDAIDKKTWEMMAGAREIELSDPLGSSLSFKLPADLWEGKGDAAGADRARYLPGHLMLPLPARDLEGVLVAESLSFGGPIPKTELTIKGRQVTKVEGEGLFGERLKQSFEQYKDQHFPGKPGPGANWLSTFVVCTHPKARPSPVYDQVAGSARVHAWTPAHRRSGVIHASIGMAMAAPQYKVIRHLNLHFPTLLADKRVVIDQGRLTALDDEQVRKTAARFGDPDKLLSEDWIPAVSD